MMPRGPRRTIGFGLFQQQSRQEMAESFPCCGVAPLFLAQYPQPCLLASFHSFAPMPGEERSLPSPHTLSCACGYSNISTPLLLVQQPLPSRAPGHLSSPVACKAPQPISADSLCPHPTPKGRAAVEEPAWCSQPPRHLSSVRQSPLCAGRRGQPARHCAWLLRGRQRSRCCRARAGTEVAAHGNSWQYCRVLELMTY